MRPAMTKISESDHSFAEHCLGSHGHKSLKLILDSGCRRGLRPSVV